jgi:plasmid stabilization system protein ParE
MRILLRPEAAAELFEAQAWYEARSPGLGLEFVRAVESAFAGAARFPEKYPCVEGELRRVILRRFPYAVFYRNDGDELLIVACYHHRRDPSTRQNRN